MYKVGDLIMIKQNGPYIKTCDIGRVGRINNIEFGRHTLDITQTEHGYYFEHELSSLVKYIDE